MPPRDECSPPKGVELLVVRGTGNKWFAEDFLDQLRHFAHGSRHLGGACPQSSTWRWTEARTTVFVGPSTRAPPGLFTLPITGRERASYVAILRHPVLRVVSRYWFEGRDLCGNQISDAPRHRRDVGSMAWRLRRSTQAPGANTKPRKAGRAHWARGSTGRDSPTARVRATCGTCLTICTRRRLVAGAARQPAQQPSIRTASAASARPWSAKRKELSRTSMV